MSAERRKVLEMLAAGQITPDDAEQLLTRLASPASPEPAAGGEAAAAAGGRAEERRPRPLRFLRIVVDSPEPGSVNIRLPLGLVRTGLKLSTLIPRGVSQRLFDRGIDLSRLSGLDDEALIAELAAHPIDIAAGDGDKVHIFCE